MAVLMMGRSDDSSVNGGTVRWETDPACVLPFVSRVEMALDGLWTLQAKAWSVCCGVG